MNTKKRRPAKINEPKKAFGAFNQGVIPTIACFNKAETPLGVNLDTLIKAMQAYVDEHVAPIWGTPANLIESTDYVEDAWAMVFLDDTDDPDSLAYHELTPDGLPLSKVFVRTTIDNNELVSVSASHELVEMLVDPAINMYTTGPNPKRITDTYMYKIGIPVWEVKVGVEVTAMYAYESADPVEEVTFKVNEVAMSDFVYPAYFEEFRKPYSVKFDHLDRVTRPFQLLSGGYQIIFIDGQYANVFGSRAKEKRFAKEDRRGHRSEIRKRRGAPQV
jgi:hypothetical protein